MCRAPFSETADGCFLGEEAAGANAVMARKTKGEYRPCGGVVSREKQLAAIGNSERQAAAGTMKEQRPNEKMKQQYRSREEGWEEHAAKQHGY